MSTTSVQVNFYCFQELPRLWVSGSCVVCTMGYQPILNPELIYYTVLLTSPFQICLLAQLILLLKTASKDMIQVTVKCQITGSIVMITMDYAT